MISDLDLARRLFPRARDIVREATAGMPATSQVRGTATADSADGTVTVVLDTEAGGSDAEMEVPTIGGVTEGSEVLVTLLDGTPVDCTRAGSVDETLGAATAAEAAAEAAQAVADAVGQHFWSDDDGAHVTQVTQDEWGDAEGASYHSGPNSLWNALGMLFRDGLTNLMAALANGIVVYDGEGNESGNIIARLLGTGAQIGRDADIHVGIDGNSVDVLKGTNNRQLITMRDSGDAGYVGATFLDSGGYEHHGAGMIVEADPEGSRMIVEINGEYNYSDIDINNFNGRTDMSINGMDAIKFSDPYDPDLRTTLQIGNPTVYQNSGEYNITTAGIDNLKNGPRVTVPPGRYIFVGQWTFNSALASGDRNMQVGFRSGASGDLWGERVRIRQSSGNFATLNVSALRTFTATTTVYLAGSASITSGSANCYITATRLN